MNKALYCLILVAIASLYSCEDNSMTASDILARSIKSHGVDLLDNSTMGFNFRGIEYQIDRQDGIYRYQRRFDKNEKIVVDELDNYGFTRSYGDSLVQLPDSLTTKYVSSLNSVVYFAQLPYGLDSNAVVLEHLGTDVIKGEEYHEIQVTFNENGGGEDYEDVFIYWINAKDYLIDYMAYSFCEDECGLRFRESIKRHEIDGVIVQDYNNYKSSKNNHELRDLDDAFGKGELDLVSKIELNQVNVSIEAKTD